MRHRLLAGVLAGGLALAADVRQPACDLLNTVKATAATIQQTVQGPLPR
jgi:type IV secretory pathway VirB2 component (pilin)